MTPSCPTLPYGVEVDGIDMLVSIKNYRYLPSHNHVVPTRKLPATLPHLAFPASWLITQHACENMDMVLMRVGNIYICRYVVQLTVKVIQPSSDAAKIDWLLIDCRCIHMLG